MRHLRNFNTDDAKRKKVEDGLDTLDSLRDLQDSIEDSAHPSRLASFGNLLLDVPLFPALFSLRQLGKGLDIASRPFEVITQVARRGTEPEIVRQALLGSPLRLPAELLQVGRKPPDERPDTPFTFSGLVEAERAEPFGAQILGGIVTDPTIALGGGKAVVKTGQVLLREGPDVARQLLKSERGALQFGDELSDVGRQFSDEQLVDMGGGVHKQLESVVRNFERSITLQKTSGQQAGIEKLLTQSREKLEVSRQAAIARGRILVDSMDIPEGAITPPAARIPEVGARTLDDIVTPPTTRRTLREVSDAAINKAFKFRAAFETQITDDAAGMNILGGWAKQIWKKAHPNTPFPERFDPELWATLFRYAPEAAKSRVDVLNSQLKRTLGSVDKNNVNKYLIAMHQLEVMALKKTRVGPEGMTAAQLRAGLLEIKENLTPDDFDRVVNASTLVRDHYLDILSRKVDVGLVKPEIATLLRDDYPWYNPIDYIEHLETTARPGGRGLSVLSNDLGLLGDLGSKKRVELPLDLVGQMTVRAEALIARQRVVRAVIESGKLQPGLGFEKVSDILPVAQVGPDTLFRKRPRAREGVLSFMETGEVVTYKVPDWVEESAKYLTFIDSNMLAHAGRFMNALPRAMLTTRNPAFIPANFMFDTLTVLLHHGVLPHRVVTSLFANLKSIIREDKVYAELIQAGMGGGGYAGRFVDQVIKSTNKSSLVTDIAFWKKLNPLEAIATFANAVESAPRRAAAVKSLKRGDSIERAAFHADRSTLDFRRAGAAVRQANNWFLYLNAGVQGFLLPGRMLRDSNRAKIMLGSFMAATLGLYAHNRRFETYNDVRTEDRYGKLVIMLRDANDEMGRPDPQYLTPVPMLREFALFSGPLLFLLAKLDDTDPISMNELWKVLDREANPLTNFAGTSGPTYAITKWNEITTNLNKFTGQPVVPDELQGFTPDEQIEQIKSGEYGGRAPSKTAQKVGGFFNISPFKIDHLAAVGAIRDIIAGVDLMLDWSKGGREPRIAQLLSEYQAILQDAPPSQVELASRDFLNDLPKVERDKVLAAHRDSDPRIPLGDSIQDRFYKHYGGQQFRTGQALAQKKHGVDPGQSRAAESYLRAVFEDLNEAEFQAHLSLQNGEITELEWRDGHQKRGSFYGGALINMQSRFPKSARALDPREYELYQREVFTLAGAIPDTRRQGQVLAAAFRAIQPTEIGPDIFNWQEFYNRRQSFLDTMSPADRAAFDREREVSMTPTEIEWEATQDTLRVYWQVHQEIFTDQPLIIELLDYYSTLNPADKRELERMVPVSAWQATVDRVRLNLRAASPQIEEALVTWYERTPLIERR